MKLLSNLFQRFDAWRATAGRPELCLRPALAGERKKAMRLVLGGGGEVARFVAMANRRGIELEAPWIVRSGRRLIWALLPLVSPGRTMLLLTPERAPAARNAQACGELIDRVCGHYSARGVQLAQVMLDPPQDAVAALYESRGFVPMAELVYLEKELQQVPSLPGLPAGFAWRTYSPAAHDDFAEVVALSYQGSLDCPPLNGLRDVEDTLAGHRATGEFDPSLWFVLSEAGRPCGVLLLSRTVQPGSGELVYLGLAPEARGRGLGDLLMRQAFAVAARAGLTRLTLAVDAGNHPAMRLYDRHGFHRASTRQALVRDLRVMSAAASPRG